VREREESEVQRPSVGLEMLEPAMESVLLCARAATVRVDQVIGEDGGGVERDPVMAANSSGAFPSLTT
jgi:hypothetical protein